MTLQNTENLRLGTQKTSCPKTQEILGPRTQEILRLRTQKMTFAKRRTHSTANRIVYVSQNAKRSGRFLAQLLRPWNSLGKDPGSNPATVFFVSEIRFGLLEPL